MVANPVKSKGSSDVIKSLANGRVSAAVKNFADDDMLRPHLLNWIENNIADHISQLVSLKNPSILSQTSATALLTITNDDIENELKIQAPLVYLVLKSIAVSKRRKSKISPGKACDNSTPNVVMTISVLMRARAQTITAMAYNIGFILHHSGAKKGEINLFMLDILNTFLREIHIFTVLILLPITLKIVPT